MTHEDRQENAIRRLEDLAELYGWLLNRFGKALLEKNIHEELEKYEAGMERKRRLGRRGAGGFEIRADGKGGLTAR